MSNTSNVQYLIAERAKRARHVIGTTAAALRALELPQHDSPPAMTDYLARYSSADKWED